MTPVIAATEKPLNNTGGRVIFCSFVGGWSRRRPKNIGSGMRPSWPDKNLVLLRCGNGSSGRPNTTCWLLEYGIQGLDVMGVVGQAVATAHRPCVNCSIVDVGALSLAAPIRETVGAVGDHIK